MIYQDLLQSPSGSQQSSIHYYHATQPGDHHHDHYGHHDHYHHATQPGDVEIVLLLSRQVESGQSLGFRCSGWNFGIKIILAKQPGPHYQNHVNHHDDHDPPPGVDPRWVGQHDLPTWTIARLKNPPGAAFASGFSDRDEDD